MNKLSNMHLINNTGGESASQDVSPKEFDTDEDEEIDNEPDLRLTLRLLAAQRSSRV